MLKTRHLVYGVACALLVTATLPAQVRERDAERPAQQRNQPADRADQAAGAGDSQLNEALAHKLILGNKAEVELGQLASQKAMSSEVKEFAQKMVKDHTAFIQKLQKFSKEKGQPVAGTDRQPGERPATQPATRPGQQIEERVAGFRGGKASMEKIHERACELHLQMTKDLLNEFKGHDFDMAYIGQQIAGHGMMVAHLKAIEENVQGGEFGTVIKEGVQTAQMHLKEAKALSDKLQKHGGQEKAPGARKEAPEIKEERKTIE